MKFSENFRALRKKCEYSQEYIAEKLGVTRQTISKWENGTAMPELKKLTEIAEFFGVTMDALLGTEVENSENQNTTDSNENTAENINQIYNTQYLETNIIKNEKNIKKLTKVCIILIVAVIVCCIFNLNFATRLSAQKSYIDSIVNNISSLQSQLDQLSVGSNRIVIDDAEGDDYGYTFLSVNKDKPYLVKTKFVFNPATYPKNAEVYFTIPAGNGETQKIPAEENNNLFTAIAEIDVTAEGDSYICIDDGKNIKKINMYTSFPEEYIKIEFSPLSVDIAGNSHKCSVTFTSQQTLYWGNSIDVKIVSAKLIAENKSKTVYTKDLTLTAEPDNRIWVIVENFDVNAFPDNIYIELVDENGVTYRYYANIDLVEGEFSEEDDNYFCEGPCYDIIFNESKHVRIYDF